MNPKAYQARLLSFGGRVVLLQRHRSFYRLNAFASQKEALQSLKLGGQLTPERIVGMAPGTRLPDGPGITLWSAFEACCPGAITEALATPGSVLTHLCVLGLVEQVFHSLLASKAVVAGRPISPAAGAQFTSFAVDEYPSWRFDLVTDIACPIAAWETPAYTNVRLFSPQEWDSIKGDRSVRPGVAALNGSAKRRDRGGAPEKFDWVPFVQEAMRFANNNGAYTRREIKRHMKTWAATHWDVPPSDDAISDRLQNTYPPETPP